VNVPDMFVVCGITKARAVCLLFLLISHKFNTLFPCHGGNIKVVCYGGGTSTGKRTAFSVSHWRMNTGSLLKIESIGQ
jgi:hypothetical protein